MATRTCDNWMHELKMSGKCSCGEVYPCVRVVLSEAYDTLVIEHDYPNDFYSRRKWLDLASVRIEYADEKRTGGQ